MGRTERVLTSTNSSLQATPRRSPGAAIAAPSSEQWAFLQQSPAGTKGANCANTLALIRRQVGEVSWPAFRGRLPPSSEALTRKPIVAFDSVRLAAWIPVVEGVIDLVGRDERRILEMAREWCDADFNGIYRFFIRLGSASFVLGRAAQVWRTYYDVGEVTLVRLPDEFGRSRAHVSLANFVPWPAFGVLFQAFVAHIIALTGGKDLVVQRRQELTAQTLGVDLEVSFVA